VLAVIATAAALATFALSPVAAGPSPGFYEQVPANLSKLKPGALIASEPESDFLPPFDNDSAAYRILFRSTGQLGQAVTVGGMVFVPKGKAPRGGWPIVVWDHGTSGVGDQCNPSRWPDLYDGGQWRGYHDQIDSLLAQGYLVVAPDYEGLGTPGLHTYLLTDALGRATIDAVRAAKVKVGSAGSRWAVIGHSEGGQAALGAGELAASYGKGLTYLGAVAYAPANHLEELIGEPNKFESPYLAYMAVGMRSIDPDFVYGNFVGSLYVDRMDLAEEHCFDEWFYLDNLGLNPTPENILNPNWASDPTVQSYFAKSQVATRPSAGPVLILQGTGDGLFEVYPELMSDLCAQGTRAHGITYANVSHDRVLETGWSDARAWLADRFAGKSAPSDCT
jgi:pimeloyl-ACP methyl ester carboxylesterase